MMENREEKPLIRAIIGLGNPGPKYYYNRHSIGFRIIDELAKRLDASWKEDYRLEYAKVMMPSAENEFLRYPSETYFVKPLTYMNECGRSVPFLLKKGIKPEGMLFIHDELEKKFGHLSIRFGGSARGHNGVRSIISIIGPDFWRLRFGIGRPERKEDVPDYVLRDFPPVEEQDVETLIKEALDTYILGEKAL